MNEETVVDAALPGGGMVQVRVAEGASGIGSVGRGGEPVSLADALEPVGEVAAIVRDKLAAVGATRASAAFGVSLSAKSGKLSALVFEVQGEASLTVTLEWDGPAPA